jgi:trans-aconitate methyltransferase
MDRAHAPIVEVAAQALGGGGGAVLDLGCGNGALLAKVRARVPSAAPVGLERDPAVAAHARRVLGPLGGTVLEGDVFSPPAALGERRYALVLLALNRLRDDPRAAPRLLDWVRPRADRVAVFCYGSWIERAGSLAAVAAPLGVEIDVPHPSGTAALVRRL